MGKVAELHRSLPKALNCREDLYHRSRYRSDCSNQGERVANLEVASKHAEVEEERKTSVQSEEYGLRDPLTTIMCGVFWCHVAWSEGNAEGSEFSAGGAGGSECRGWLCDLCVSDGSVALITPFLASLSSELLLKLFQHPVL